MKAFEVNAMTRGGFTLLELLASMAILAILMTLLFAAFSQASRAWLQAENRVETFSQARAALDFMSRELSQAIATTNISFLGSRDSIAFIAPVSADTADGMDLVEVVYQLNGNGLVREVTPYLSAGVVNPDWDFYSQLQTWPGTTGPNAPTTLADNIISLALSYVDATGALIPSPSFWNSTTILSPNWAENQTPLAPMLNRTPAGVYITIRAIDNRTAKRLQPGMSAAVSNNIINPAKQSFRAFVAIPNRQP